tara:strand:+ start:29233 stop:29712 length:480 start_codon:yes stop_codon:yes gene_type:complete
MTKKLEDLLNLPEAKEVKEPKSKIVVEVEETIRDISELDKIAAALPSVKGLGEMADRELNEIADKAMASYEDLMDLGMNVEARYASRVFEVAGGMLKTSLDAKVAKLDKKLKMVELQLKKQKIDQDNNGPGDGFTEGEGYVVTDRNSLLERLKGMNSDK